MQAAYESLIPAVCYRDACRLRATGQSGPGQQKAPDHESTTSRPYNAAEILDLLSSYFTVPSELQELKFTMKTLQTAAVLLTTASVALAQFHADPEGITVLQSKFGEGVTISYKEVRQRRPSLGQLLIKFSLVFVRLHRE